MLILFFTPECGLGDNKCSQLYIVINKMTDKDFKEFIDIVLPKASEEQITSILPTIIKEADESAKVMAQIDPLVHPMGEA